MTEVAAAALGMATAWAVIKIARLLRLRSRGDKNNAFPNGIFPSAGPVTGGAVQYQPIPDVADSPAWSANQSPTFVRHEDPTFEEALGIVLAVGGRLRLCTPCGSPATEIVGEEWEWHNESVWMRCIESCQDCGHRATYHVSADFWTAIEAMRTWESARTARAAALQMIANQAELAVLDKDAPDGTRRQEAIDAASRAGIPKAIMFCTHCNQYLESRDGKGECHCLQPFIVEG